MPRILVVDDDVLLAQLVGQYLQRRGCEVTVAANGEQAITQAAEMWPDALVTDLNMPGIDGLALIRYVRDREINVESCLVAQDEGETTQAKRPIMSPRLPIVVHTGSMDPAVRAEALALEVSAYLVKPVPLGRLLEAIVRAAGL